MTTVAGPFLRTYRYLQREAHERPVIFYSLVLGIAGPVMAYTIPSIRENYFGYKPAERVPITYPLPQRPRRPVSPGYDD
ncbi:hypothetical protein F5146DRAFT_953055 [Armillaria mellea]|nr:hypothetical protein F5146DRAFT_953055 [Armillaria mellea]